MSIWAFTDDDYSALEAERLDKLRPAKERQQEQEFLQEVGGRTDTEEELLLEQLDEQRSEEERQQEREHLEALYNNIEDQDELDRRFQESLSQEPIVQFQRMEAEMGQSLPEQLDIQPQQLRNRMETRPAISLESSFIPHSKQEQAPLAEAQQQTPTHTQAPILPQHPQKQPSSKKPSAYDVAQVLISSEKFIVIKNAIYWYNRMIYQFLAREDALRLIVDRCRLAIKDVGSANFVKQVLEFLQDEPSICNNNLQPSPDKLVFLDGILDLKTGAFFAHTPEVFATSYLNVRYKIGIRSSCPRFDQFVSSIAGGDTVLSQRIWEAIGYLLTQDQRGKGFILLQGPSDTGKSVLGNFIRKCLNNEAVASLALHDFGKNFALASLLGKNLCVDDDLQEGIINSKAVSNLKKMTGGDLLYADIKYMPGVSFVNTAKLLFATNHAIITESNDDAFRRRIVVIPFSNVIPRTEQDGDYVEYLLPEMDAVVAKALTYYGKPRENRYVFAGEYGLNMTIEGIKLLPDRIAEFFHKHCLEEPGVWTPTEEFYTKFISEHGNICAKNSFSETFSLIVKGAFASVEKVRGRVEGKGNPIWGFSGLALRNRST